MNECKKSETVFFSVDVWLETYDHIVHMKGTPDGVINKHKFTSFINKIKQLWGKNVFTKYTRYFIYGMFCADECHYLPYVIYTS